MGPTTQTEHYRIRVDDVDDGGQLTATALCNYLQDAASHHASALGLSIVQLQDEGMTWFLWRLHLRLAELPAWGAQVSVTTWPSGVRRHYAARDFRVHDRSVATRTEREIAVASTAWVVVDTTTQRLIPRVPERVRGHMPVEVPTRALTDSFRRLPRYEDGTAEGTFVVRRHDLDVNGHLNHVATIEAMLEGVPREIVTGRRLAELEVELKAEGREGDVMSARCVALEPEEAREGTSARLGHALVRESDGKVAARARTRWQEAE